VIDIDIGECLQSVTGPYHACRVRTESVL